MDDRSRCPAQEPLELAFGCGPSDATLFGALDAPENAPGGCGALCAWDAESGERLYSLDFRGCAHVGCVHVASAGDSFLVGAADGSIRQLDARDGASVFRYSTGMGDVNMVSLSCDGTYVQAAGDSLIELCGACDGCMRCAHARSTCTGAVQHAVAWPQSSVAFVCSV